MNRARKYRDCGENGRPPPLGGRPDGAPEAQGRAERGVPLSPREREAPRLAGGPGPSGARRVAPGKRAEGERAGDGTPTSGRPEGGGPPGRPDTGEAALSARATAERAPKKRSPNAQRARRPKTPEGRRRRGHPQAQSKRPNGSHATTLAE